MNENKIASLAQAFFLHLINEKDYREKTAKNTRACVSQYLQWLQEEKLIIKKATFKDLLNYIGYLQKENKSKNKINHQLRTISNYHNYLGIADIAKDVRLRGVKKEQGFYLSDEELNQFYNNFVSSNKKGHYLHSDKIMLGLTIYQALDMKDIFNIELNDLNLAEGKIYIKGGLKRKDARTLDLQAHQILPLSNYITNYRKVFHKDHTQISDKLFTPNCDKPHRLHDQLKIINKAIRVQAKEQNLKCDKLTTLRQSRIVLWIKQYGLRKAQYLGGFRAIYSVEKYKQQDITDLQDYIKALHPMKN